MKKNLKYLIVNFFVVLISQVIFQCNSAKNKNETALMERSPKAGNPTFNYVFKNGEEGYTCYRIPAIVRTNEGTLLAFAEGRKGGCSDTGDIDLLLKRSEDSGKTWSKGKVIWDDSVNTCGNPAPVVDKETGKIFLLSTWNLGIDHEKDILDGTSTDTRRVFVLSSSDNGLNWSEPQDITAQVKRDNWTWYATGPVSGIQLQRSKFKGRLVVPSDHIEELTKKAGSHVIYSDNHGETWELGGVAPNSQVNESTVAELSSGKVMLNMRNYDKNEDFRKVAISEDGGMSWSEVYSDSSLVEPICQGSLISYKKRNENYLVFANPASKSKRANMTIRLSADDGKTWPVSKTIYQGPSAYSGLVSLHNGDIGIYYEGGIERPYEGLAFKLIEAKEVNINK